VGLDHSRPKGRIKLASFGDDDATRVFRSIKKIARRMGRTKRAVRKMLCVIREVKSTPNEVEVWWVLPEIVNNAAAEN
jgi:hypothetical protein